MADSYGCEVFEYFMGLDLKISWEVKCLFVVLLASVFFKHSEALRMAPSVLQADPPSLFLLIIPPPLPSFVPKIVDTACFQLCFLKSAPTILTTTLSCPFVVVYLPPNRSPNPTPEVPPAQPSSNNTSNVLLPCSDIFCRSLSPTG